MSKDTENITKLKRIAEKIITIKIFVIFSITYLVTGTLEDYFFWIIQEEWLSFVFGSMASVIMLVMTVFAIALFFKTVINKELRGTQKICRILLIFCIFRSLLYISVMINDYLSEGKIVDGDSMYSVLYFNEYTEEKVNDILFG